MLKYKYASFMVGISLAILILTQLVGCSTNKPSEDTGININQDLEITNKQTGETETFKYGDLKLEITNVQDISIEKVVDDGGTPWNIKFSHVIPMQRLLF